MTQVMLEGNGAGVCFDIVHEDHFELSNIIEKFIIEKFPGLELARARSSGLLDSICIGIKSQSNSQILYNIIFWIYPIGAYEELERTGEGTDVS